MTIILQSEEIKQIVHLNSELIPIIEEAFKSLSKGVYALRYAYQCALWKCFFHELNIYL